MRKPRHFSDSAAAKRAGRRGGKNVPPSLRYFSVNREAAAEAGRKSRYVAPKPKKVPDDTKARALFEGIPGDYPQLVPWEQLDEPARQFWRKQANILLKDGVDPATEIHLLGNASNLG